MWVMMPEGWRLFERKEYKIHQCPYFAKASEAMEEVGNDKNQVEN